MTSPTFCNHCHSVVTHQTGVSLVLVLSLVHPQHTLQPLLLARLPHPGVAPGAAEVTPDLQVLEEVSHADELSLIPSWEHVGQRCCHCEGLQTTDGAATERDSSM